MLCHVMSCHVMSCHVMSCHVMSCHGTSCRVVSCHVSCLPTTDKRAGLPQVLTAHDKTKLCTKHGACHTTRNAPRTRRNAANKRTTSRAHPTRTSRMTRSTPPRPQVLRLHHKTSFARALRLPRGRPARARSAALATRNAPGTSNLPGRFLHVLAVTL